MPRFIFDIPLLIAGPLLVVLISALAVGGLLFVRRRVLPRLRFTEEDAIFSSTMLLAIMVFYGLTVALIALSVWEKHSELVPTIGENVVALASIARHVVPAKDAFEAWLKAILAKLAKTYPMNLEFYDEDTETYDSSYEKPVPKEFFDPKSSMDDAKARALLKEFLKGLDPKKNPYLTPASEMIKRGFKGKPYTM